MRKISCLLSLLFIFPLISNFAQFTVKDQEKPANTLLQINDEGHAGSITLPDAKITLNGNKLYNNGDKLYWGSNKIATDGNAAGWTRNGNNIYTQSNLYNVGIGISAPSAKLHVQSTNTYSLFATFNDGVYGRSNTSGGSGVAGINTGSGNGIYGQSTNGNAGKFVGNVNVTGKIYNSKNVQIESQNDTIVLKAANTVLKIRPDGTILIQGDGDIKIQSERNLDLISQGNLNLYGNNVNIGASTNISLNGGLDVNLQSSGNMNFQSSKGFSLGVTDDLNLTAGKDLFLQNNNAFNKIHVNGDIDIEGRNITIKASEDLTLKGKRIIEN